MYREYLIKDYSNWEDEGFNATLKIVSTQELLDILERIVNGEEKAKIAVHEIGPCVLDWSAG